MIFPVTEILGAYARERELGTYLKRLAGIAVKVGAGKHCFPGKYVCLYIKKISEITILCFIKYK